MEDEVKYEYKSTPAKGEKNSQLTVGYNNDRSFVVRGNQIGVFKHNPDSLEFSTTIQDIKGMNGKTFSPSKVPLHCFRFQGWCLLFLLSCAFLNTTRPCSTTKIPPWY